MSTLIINADIVTSGSIRKKAGLFINRDGRIADVFDMQDFDRAKYGDVDSVLDVKGRLLCPGLIDTHIHGIGGFEPASTEPEPTLRMSETLVRFGVTSFLPTLYAGSEEKMEKEASGIVKAMGHETGARILGINMEGPFLSPAKSGAQDPQALILPDREVLERLVASGDGHVVAMTVAPELKGIEKITDEAKKQGIVLLRGHTNATYEEALKGKALGINHTTHMFNAISKMDHKAPGAVGAVLFDPNMNCEVIADGVHVHRDLVCYLIGTKGSDHVVLITDSLRPTSLGPGKYVINGDNVVLGELGAFVLEKDHSKLCGSALTLNKAVKNVASWTGNVASAVKMASENPASLYGFSDIGSIAKGKLADLAVFDDSFNATEVFVGGKLVYSK